MIGNEFDVDKLIEAVEPEVGAFNSDTAARNYAVVVDEGECLCQLGASPIELDTAGVILRGERITRAGEVISSNDRNGADFHEGVGGEGASVGNSKGGGAPCDHRQQGRECEKKKLLHVAPYS